MKSETFWIGLGGVAIGILFMIAFAPSWGGMMGSKNRMTGPTGTTAQGGQMMGSIDKHFIEQMIPHHEGAVAMATLALTKSKRSEIKTLASAIVAAQNKEIVDMTGWYKNWFGNEVPKGSVTDMGGGMMSGSGMHMGGAEDMNALETATDFDKAFLEAMIPHHQLALMMVRMFEAGTNRPEMIQLAKNISVSQAKEIKDMQAWYTEWYGRKGQ